MEYLTYFVLPLAAFLIAGLIISAAYLTFQREKSLKATDSFFGTAVLSDPLIGREKDLRFLISRIKTGQSSAIIGPFSQERTAILTYLRNPEDARLLYGDQADKLIFSYVDVSSLKIDCTPAEFWERALKPLQEKIKNADPTLYEVCQECKDNRFDNYYLEKLVEQMSSEGWRLVLMLDRFEELLFRSLLSNPEFGGKLRSLASFHTPSSLILIVSGSITITELHRRIADQIGFGSPWFNFLEAGLVTLYALSDTDIDELLRKSVSPFTDKAEARQFVKDVAGGHPYLVQLAAAVLLEVYENRETPPEMRAGEVFYNRVKGSLAQILRLLPQTTCEVFRAVADKQNVSHFDTDLKGLERQGFVKQDENGQWQIRPQVFLDFFKENANNSDLCKPMAQPH